MNVCKLVAALVLRVGVPGVVEPLSWAKMGVVFDLTQDQIRHRLTAFKKKYNVVDADVSSDWNRVFLSHNCPESEKSDISGLKFWPGDVVSYLDCENSKGIILGYGHDEYDVYEVDTGVVDSVFDDEIEGDEVKVDVEVADSYLGTALNDAKPQEDIPAPQFLVTPACLVVIRGQQPLTIDRSHKNFEKIKDALDEKKWQLAFDLIDMKNTITKYSNGRVEVKNGLVTLDGANVHGMLSDRLLSALTDENVEALEGLTNFMQKSDDNPDARVLSRLFSFMKAKDIRLDKDGDFYAYKVVGGNYLDKYSGTMNNKPGEVVKMKRNLVNPIDSETCSTGLHVCSKSYIKHFSGGGGDRVVLCKVNPKDVVSVPADYGDAKMRVCEYVVVKDITENFTDEHPGLQA